MYFIYGLQSSSIASAQFCNSQSRANAAYLRGLSIARLSISHALMSRMLDVRAVCAEHFVEEGSMERSYDMIQRVMKAMHIEVPVLHGERGSLAKHENEEPSEAVRFIIQEAERERQSAVCALHRRDDQRGQGAYNTPSDSAENDNRNNRRQSARLRESGPGI